MAKMKNNENNKSIKLMHLLCKTNFFLPAPFLCTTMSEDDKGQVWYRLFAEENVVLIPFFILPFHELFYIFSFL